MLSGQVVFAVPLWRCERGGRGRKKVHLKTHAPLGGCVGKNANDVFFRHSVEGTGPYSPLTSSSSGGVLGPTKTLK